MINVLGFSIHVYTSTATFCLNLDFNLANCLSSYIGGWVGGYVPCYVCTHIVSPCSAGVGRTGTLITIYSMIKMIEDVEEVDVFNYVLKMRSQRTYMVQTEVCGECAVTLLQRHWVLLLNVHSPCMHANISCCRTLKTTHPCPTPCPTPYCPHRNSTSSSMMPC